MTTESPTLTHEQQVAWNCGPDLEGGMVKFFTDVSNLGVRLRARQEVQDGDYIFLYTWDGTAWKEDGR